MARGREPGAQRNLRSRRTTLLADGTASCCEHDGGGWWLAGGLGLSAQQSTNASRSCRVAQTESLRSDIPWLCSILYVNMQKEVWKLML